MSSAVKPSKTWVLPPRPKPGRKSKKVAEVIVAKASSVDGPDDNEANVSRIKQKASRERKQEYIVELEAKLRAYEQGDGERATFFQNLAKKHSEENEALRTENDSLRSAIAILEARLQQFPQSRSDPIHSASTLTRKPSSDLKGIASRAKRQRTRSTSVASSTSSSTADAIYLPTSSPIDPVVAPDQSYPQQQSPQPQGQPVRQSYIQRQDEATAMTVSARDATPSLSLSPASPYQPSSPSLSAASGTTFSALPDPAVSLTSGSGGCGLCDDKNGTGQCICEDIGIGRPSASSKCASSSKASCGLCVENGSMCICEDIGIGRPDAPSKLENSFQAASSQTPIPHSHPHQQSPQSLVVASTMGTARAIPLRRPKKGVPSGKVWRLDYDNSAQLASVTAPTTAPSTSRLAQGAPVKPPSPAAAAGVALRRRLIKVGSRLPCSGDPRTCPACADDPAGQAFCSALSSTVCLTNPCASCPNRPSPLANEVRMQSSTPTPFDPSEAVSEALTLRRRDSSARDEVPEAMIPCSDAWATLREHPNIGFANLDLLASVVAKRTVCSGDKHDGNASANTRAEVDGKIVEVGREGVEEALELLDHVRD